jgi:hypothetical protein
VLTTIHERNDVRTRSYPPSARIALTRARLIGAASASVLILGSYVLGGSAALAAASPATVSRPVVTLTGMVPALPAARAAVYAQVELPLDRNAHGVPQRIDAVTVAGESITSRGFSLPVPGSATLDQAERIGHGIVNFDIIVLSGGSATSWGLSVPVTATAATLDHAQRATETAHVARIPALPAFQQDRHPQGQALNPYAEPPPTCTWSTVGGETDSLTRIGEIHIANVAGVSDRYSYSVENDETISFGISATSSDSGWTEAGNISMTNSLSATGGKTFGKAARAYVYTTGYYQEYVGRGTYGGCSGNDEEWEVEQVGTAADIETSGTAAPSQRSSLCSSDSLHIALQAGADWASDRGVSKTYLNGVTFDGFDFNVSDGFTSHIIQQFSASASAPTTYICGIAGDQPTNTPILYDTT